MNILGRIKNGKLLPFDSIWPESYYKLFVPTELGTNEDYSDEEILNMCGYVRVK